MENCTCTAASVLFFSCSGGSNVGQIANQAAIALTKDKAGKMYCLAGVGGHIESFIESSKGNRLVVIDGCPVSCAKKIFEHTELPVDVHIVVTGLGVKKEGSFQLHEEDIAKVCNEIKRQLK